MSATHLQDRLDDLEARLDELGRPPSSLQPNIFTTTGGVIGGLYVVNSHNAPASVDFGSVQITIGANAQTGIATVNHGITRVPTCVVTGIDATATNQTSSYKAEITSLSTTQIGLLARGSPTNPLAQTVTVYWLAIG